MFAFAKTQRVHQTTDTWTDGANATMSRDRDTWFAYVATNKALQSPCTAGETGTVFSQRYREVGNSGWT